MSLFCSIIINNYNYALFLREAIASALNQTWTNREIIVVDDGSTDNSRHIIESFGNRILPVFKENAGQASAYNAGFLVSSGDLVLFLDADDFLYPECLESVVNAWTPDCSKAHYPLDIVTEAGTPTGKRIPRILHNGNLLPLLEKFGHYSSPPGSGNIYSARFLHEILPLSEELWIVDADSVPITLAPLFGPVVGLDTALAAHRVHHRGNSVNGTSGLNNPDHAGRLASFVRREERRYNALHDAIARKNHTLKIPPYPKSPHLLRLHVGYLILHAPVVEKDKISRLCIVGIKTCLTFPGYRLHERILLLSCFLLLFFFPGLSKKYLFPRILK